MVDFLLFIFILCVICKIFIDHNSVAPTDAKKENPQQPKRTTHTSTQGKTPLKAAVPKITPENTDEIKLRRDKVPIKISGPNTTIVAVLSNNEDDNISPQKTEDGLDLRRIGDYYFYAEGVFRDYKKAFDCYKAAAAVGDSASAIFIGRMYLKGLAVACDYEEALIWYRKAFNMGYVEASQETQRIALEFYNGNTLLGQDFSSAFQWFKYLATVCNDDVAMYYMGKMYFDGHGVNKDYKEALKWFIKATESGNNVAERAIMDSANIFYNSREYSKPDYQRAFQWFNYLAKKGNAVGMRRMGSLYYRGLGVTRDYDKAFRWYKKAADAGDYYASTIIEKMIDLKQCKVKNIRETPQTKISLQKADSNQPMTLNNHTDNEDAFWGPVYIDIK